MDHLFSKKFKKNQITKIEQLELRMFFPPLIVAEFLFCILSISCRSSRIF